MSVRYNKDFKMEVVKAYMAGYRFIFDSTEGLNEMTKKYINWYNYVRSHHTHIIII